MKLEKLLSVIFMSAVICFFAVLAGLVFNIFNPGGFSLIPKKEPARTRVIKPIPAEAKNREKVVAAKKAVTASTKTQTPAVKTLQKKKIFSTEVAPVLTAKLKSVTAEIAPVEETKITLEKAKSYFDEGKAVFIDARPEYVYVERHIKGAVSLSASRFVAQYERIKDELKKEALYIVYCSGGSCHLSDIVVKNLEEKGFENTKIFRGGWDEWRKAGYPVEGLQIKKETVTK
jgi:rhodanese-related sulfurtransferase